tara:strand:- start:202 stop:531 length:330 start_codon:yes stop_codon:yes gene_type:complete
VFHNACGKFLILLTGVLFIEDAVALVPQSYAAKEVGALPAAVNGIRYIVAPFRNVVATNQVSHAYTRNTAIVTEFHIVTPNMYIAAIVGTHQTIGTVPTVSHPIAVETV